MRCTQARRLMAMALADDTDERQHSDLDQHLADCSDCARQWQDLSRNAATVEQARPAATETSADLVAAAMERIRPRPRGRAVRIGWTARAAAVALMVAAALWMTTRPPDKMALLARVEAALAVVPSYRVYSQYDAAGELLARGEMWRLADGGTYGRTLVGESLDRMRTYPHAYVWWREKDDRYYVHWQGGRDDTHWDDLNQRAEESATEADISPQVDGETRFMIGQALANSDELVEATETWGELGDQRTRVIRLRTESRKPVDRIRQCHDVDVTIHRDPSTGRALRITQTWGDPGGAERRTADHYPIRYDVEPPPSISTTIPKGTMVAMRGGTYHGEMVDPVWEHMSEVERERLTEVVRDTIGGWAQGDFAAFSRHYDFAGVTEYGVKGKFTPEEMAEHWRRDVERRRGLVQTCEVRVDYAVATAKPPGRVVSIWSIYRTGLPAGEGWITYRDEPTDEPGITVFGRLTVTQTDGKTRDAATLLFLKQVEGEYRVIGWVPPF